MCNVVTAVHESAAERVTVTGGHAGSEDITAADAARCVSSHLTGAEGVGAPHTGSAVARTGAWVQSAVSKVGLVASTDDRGEVRSEISCAEV